MSYCSDCVKLQEEIASLKKENERLKWKECGEIFQENKDLKEEIKKLNIIIYSNDTSEWKSAAFQKIKTLESQVTQLVEALEWADHAGDFYNIAWQPEDEIKYAQFKKAITAYRTQSLRKRVR